MAKFIVRPERFMIEAAIIDWLETIRAGRLSDNAAAAIRANLKELGIPVRAAHLRWSLHPELGIPTEPFIVWRRPIVVFEGFENIKPTYTYQLANATRVIGWSRPLAIVTLRLKVPGPNALVIGTSGAPTLNRASAFKTVPAGTHNVELTGPDLTGVILYGAGVEIENMVGVRPNVVANNPGWQQVEVVGLPVKPENWAGVGKHDTDQGLLASGLLSPGEAANQRLLRGTPLVGWDAEISPGVMAPPWKLPDREGLIDEMRGQILPYLREMAELAPIKQQEFLQRITMPPPENNGKPVDAEPSEAEFSPLGVLSSGVTSDPLLSLVLGYGTAIQQEDLPTITLGDRQLFAGKDDFDYMVTARWERGLHNRSRRALNYAALALRPSMALAGAAPANMESLVSAPLRPQHPDGNWRRSVRLKWDRLPKTGLYRIASYAAVRAPVTPAGDSHILNEERDSGGILPISANSNPSDTLEPMHLSSVDREVEIPTGPGFTQLNYAVATQTIFGLWGRWTTTPATLIEPGLDPLQILAADFHCTNSDSAICDAELVIDLAWDWSIRSPQQFVLRARMYGAAFRGVQPSDTSVPGNFPRSLGAADSQLVISFENDDPDDPQVSDEHTIQAMSPDGSQFVTPGSAQSDDVRRYRLTMRGFTLDFSSTPHICLALWSRGRERIAPTSFGPWSSEPFIASASDPRPLAIVTDYVQLASLADAKGECHARIVWPEVPAALGYIVYETTETRLRHELGLADTPQTDTLETRLATLRTEYSNNPTRRPFTRRGKELHQGTSLDITLPRGSTDIHCFMVLTQNAAQVESEWPDGTDGNEVGDRLIPIAAPRISTPQAPTLEVRRIKDDTVSPTSYHAWLRINTRPGPRVKQIDVYRCRVTDAVRQIDTMGPPLIRLTNTLPNWQLEKESDAVASDFITVATGVDEPEGSWKKVWYRCVVWSEDDPARGLLKGRSTSSSPQWVVIPPDTPPPLSVLSAEWPGGPLQDVLLRWTSTAPINPTTLGAHHLSIVASVAGSDIGAEDMINVDQPLENLPSASPPSDKSGVWREGTPAANQSQEYRALIRRDSLDDALRIAVRLRDPLGRISERLLQVSAGAIDPEPDITDLQIRTNSKKLKVVTWSSNVPVQETLAGAYQVSIIADVMTSSGIRRFPIIVNPRNVERAEQADQPDLNTRFIRPLPDSLNRNRLRIPGRKRIIKRRLTLDIPDIPVIKLIRDKKLLLKTPKTGLSLWRKAGAIQQYGVASRENVVRFTIRITAPDGRHAESTVKVK